MKKILTLLLLTSLTGCVVVPARPVAYAPEPVVYAGPGYYGYHHHGGYYWR